jgi:hypothetical protein
MPWQWDSFTEAKEWHYDRKVQVRTLLLGERTTVEGIVESMSTGDLSRTASLVCQRRDALTCMCGDTYLSKSHLERLPRAAEIISGVGQVSAGPQAYDSHLWNIGKDLVAQRPDHSQRLSM